MHPALDFQYTQGLHLPELCNCILNSGVGIPEGGGACGRASGPSVKNALPAVNGSNVGLLPELSEAKLSATSEEDAELEKEPTSDSL
jgi:hypothetical protein